MTAFRKFRKAYESTAIVLLNTIILILVVNLSLGAAYWAKDTVSLTALSRPEDGRLFRSDGAPVRTAKRTERQIDWFDYTAYGDIDPSYAADVLDDFYEFAQLGFVYQPWVQFSEALFDGRRVHVDIDERGFPLRRTINSRCEGEDRVVRVFVIGGSTTFGDLVSDEHTWPSFLSTALNDRAVAEGRPYRIEVRNYGRGFFYPTQETALLADLLRSGHRPSLVIFLDGVNWGGESDVPQFNPQVAEMFIARQFGSDITRADLLAKLDWVPIIRFVQSVKSKLDARPDSERDSQGSVSGDERDRRADMAVQRFQQNRRVASAICDLYGCETLFFLQPSVLYKYNLDLYRRDLPEAFRLSLQPAETFYDRLRQDSSYIDLSHLFLAWGADRKAVVDDLHYSPDFGRYLAEQVAAFVDLDDVLVFPEVVEESAATGPIRSIVTKDGWIVPSRDGKLSLGVCHEGDVARG